jgi:hypothetical protein
MQNPINLIDPTGMSPEGDPVNPPKDAKEGQTHSEHRNSITYNYTYESGSWTESEAIIDTVVINRNVKNASGVSNSSLWRYVPIIGSGLDSYDAFSKGEYLKGTAYLALAVSDVFLVKSLAVGTGKFALRSLAKTSASVVDDVATKGGSIALKGFTQHAAAESAITRGFKTADILKICKEGTQEVIRNGSQIRYTLQGNSIVVQQTGRNAGKVVTVFSNSPGTAKGLGKGAFIPWK